MSLKNASERIKKRSQEIRGEIRGTVESLGQTIPRPIMERRTLILREPLIKMFKERMKKER